MAPSSSGPGRLVLSQEIRGSNPLGATIYGRRHCLRPFYLVQSLPMLITRQKAELPDAAMSAKEGNHVFLFFFKGNRERCLTSVVTGIDIYPLFYK